jgi:hypothetical protein
MSRRLWSTVARRVFGGRWRRCWGRRVRRVRVSCRHEANGAGRFGEHGVGGVVGGGVFYGSLLWPREVFGSGEALVRGVGLPWPEECPWM